MGNGEDPDGAALDRLLAEQGAALERLLAELDTGWGLPTTFPSAAPRPTQQAAGGTRSRKALRPPCGARTRMGTPCRARAVEGRDRCRMHGGLSTGPKTAEGRARIAESNRRRAGTGKGQLASRNHS